MPISNIDSSDIQDSYLADSANDTYHRHGVSKGARNYIPVGIDTIDMFDSAGISADTAADIADSYARDRIGCVNTPDRHGIAGIRRKHATYNAGRNTNVIYR